MLFFSITYNIYLKKGFLFFFLGGGEIFHSFRISLITLSFLQCLSYFLEYSISFIHFTHHLTHLSQFLRGMPGGAYRCFFFFGGGGGQKTPWGLSVGILVDIPL